MNKELTEKLRQMYPTILRDLYGDPRKTCMAWGIACGEGWYRILDDLFENIISTTIGTNKKFVATQIKEKWGGLRIYYSIENIGPPSWVEKISNDFRTFMFNHRKARTWNRLNNLKKKVWKSTVEKIDDFIYEAEVASFQTCERCGNPGGPRYDVGWIKTLCISCYVEKLEK